MILERQKRSAGKDEFESPELTAEGPLTVGTERDHVTVFKPI